MKKFVFMMMFALFTINSTASAQDVYATTKDGYEYYVMKETVNKNDYTDSENGKTHHITKVTGDVKRVNAGKLIEIQPWTFVSIDYHTWQYRYKNNGQEIRGSFSGSWSKYAMDILHVMYPY